MNTADIVARIPRMKYSELECLDALDLASKLTGQSYKDDEATTLLGMQIQSTISKRTDELMKTQRDSSFNTKFEDFKQYAIEEGFTEVLSWDSPYEGRNETISFFFNKDTGALLRLTSWLGEQTNNADLYFQIRHKDEKQIFVKSLCISGGAVFRPNFGNELTDNLMSGHLDVRTGFRHSLRVLSQEANYAPTWQYNETGGGKPSYAIFVPYWEWYSDEYNELEGCHQARTNLIARINDENLEKLPEWVKQQIGTNNLKAKQ